MKKKICLGAIFLLAVTENKLYLHRQTETHRAMNIPTTILEMPQVKAAIYAVRIVWEERSAGVLGAREFLDNLDADMTATLRLMFKHYGKPTDSFRSFTCRLAGI